MKHSATLVIALLSIVSPVAAEEPLPESVQTLLRTAQRHYQQDKTEQAIEVAGQAVKAAPKRIEPHFMRAMFLSDDQQWDKAVADLDRVVELRPKLAEAYYRRGRLHYLAAKPKLSVADFDRYVALKPEREKSLWERGISHYYTGQFKEGARQFELYQTYLGNDVENGVWRYLCMARSDGVKKAQASMLDIKGDRRVPMTEIYRLYRGELKPADVLTAATAGQASKSQQSHRLFYAHLYLGLYHEVHNRPKQALKHLRLAADKYRITHYMGDVARVHLELEKKQ
jgi:lipoprotein NlpI